MSDGANEVRWAHRVPQDLIHRLYAGEARGQLDEALLEDVGIRFCLRCESILAVAEATGGRIACPRCAAAGTRTVVLRVSMDDGEEPLRCAACGWATTWSAYYRRCMHRQLSQGGAKSVFREFLARWRAAKSPAEKMIAVDQVIHAFHAYLMEHRRTGERGRQPTRSVAVNLIEGKLNEVVAFLEELAGHAPRHPELSASLAVWRDRARSSQEHVWRDWRIVRKSLRG